MFAQAVREGTSGHRKGVMRCVGKFPELENCYL